MNRLFRTAVPVAFVKGSSLSACRAGWRHRFGHADGECAECHSTLTYNLLNTYDGPIDRDWNRSL